MDMIDRKLMTDSITHTYELAIRASFRLAKKTLNCYYSMTDWSEVYRIAMGEFFCHFVLLCYKSTLLTMTLPVLHPRHKLSYFKEAGWGAQWIQAAESIIHEEFERSYTSATNNTDLDDAMDEDKVQETSAVCTYSLV